MFIYENNARRVLNNGDEESNAPSQNTDKAVGGLNSYVTYELRESPPTAHKKLSRMGDGPGSLRKGKLWIFTRYILNHKRHI